MPLAMVTWQGTGGRLSRSSRHRTTKSPTDRNDSGNGTPRLLRNVHHVNEKERRVASRLTAASAPRRSAKARQRRHPRDAAELTETRELAPLGPFMLNPGHFPPHLIGAITSSARERTRGGMILMRGTNNSRTKWDPLLLG